MTLSDECFHEKDITVKTKTLKPDSHLPKKIALFASLKAL